MAKGLQFGAEQRWRGLKQRQRQLDGVERKRVPKATQADRMHLREEPGEVADPDARGASTEPRWDASARHAGR